MIKTQGTGFFEEQKVIATNRTGGTLTVGGVYALDLARSDAASTSIETACGNVVANATANIRGFLVVATQALADDATGVFVLKGRTRLLVNGTTDVAAGDRLKAVNATNALVLGAGLFNPCGIALEAQTANAATLTDCYFDGENWQGEVAAS